jgi:IS605 OrfB family transposase
MRLTHLAVGDLNGIRNGNNLGKRTNQKLHNFWSHATTLKRIKELGEEFAIQIKLVSEAYTSATCCMCGLQHNGRIHRGLHVCRQVHKSINADVSGAYNIYNVAVNRTLFKGRGTSGSRLMAQPLMLRWEYHQWHQEPQSFRAERMSDAHHGESLLAGFWNTGGCENRFQSIEKSAPRHRV